MKSFEYKIFPYKRDSTGEVSSEPFMNELGEKGWDIFYVERERDWTMFYAKREIPKPSHSYNPDNDSLQGIPASPEGER